MYASMGKFIVCGWYTPDYERWVLPLKSRLDALQVPHDFSAVEKRIGGWELNVQTKPIHIRQAMDRHPCLPIIFVDVDCQVTGSRDDLCGIASIVGDVGLYVRTRIRSNGRPLFAPRSGTLVLNPTPRARALVEKWIAVSETAPRYAVDQTTLTVALGRVPGITITTLGVGACAIPSDKADAPIILHDRAGQAMKKTPRLIKLLSASFRR
jgi:hypothetical protein